ncbi:MAG TPA: NUDIX hydrolase [Planctomycetaceae bacterium]|nr:NUDIX hydrolase [Planctomycetaceae bacterium]
MSADGWEYAERIGSTGVVVVIPVTEDGTVLLTEQFRAPVGRRVIDWPAGLAGDVAGEESESLANAARRELLEEVGGKARRLVRLAECPTSPGMTAEIVTLFHAADVKRVSVGGGEGSEDIEIHEVPLAGIDGWLRRKARSGRLIDPKVYAGLYLLEHGRGM